MFSLTVLLCRGPYKHLFGFGTLRITSADLIFFFCSLRKILLEPLSETPSVSLDVQESLKI